MNDAYYYRSFATDLTDSNAPHHHSSSNKKHHTHHHNKGKLITPENALNKHHPHIHYNSQLHGHYEQHPRPHGHHRPDREVVDEPIHSSEDNSFHPEAHRFHFKEGSELESGLNRLYAEHVDQLNPFDYSHDPVTPTPAPSIPPIIHHSQPTPVTHSLPPVLKHPTGNTIHSIPTHVSPMTQHHLAEKHTNIPHGETSEEFNLYGDLSGITPQTTGMTPKTMGMGSDIEIPADHPSNVDHTASTKTGIPMVSDDVISHLDQAGTHHERTVDDMIAQINQLDESGIGGANHVTPQINIPSGQSSGAGEDDFHFDPNFDGNPNQTRHYKVIGDNIPLHSQVPSHHHLGHSNTGPAHNFGDHPGVGADLTDSSITKDAFGMGHELLNHDYTGPDGSDDFIGDLYPHPSHPLLHRTPVTIPQEHIDSIENVHDAQDLQDRLNAIKKDNEDQEQQHKQQDQSPVNQLSNAVQGGLNFLGGLFTPQTTSHLAIGGAMNSLPSHLSSSSKKHSSPITRKKSIGKAHLAKNDANLNKNDEYNNYMNDIIGQVKQNSYLFMDAGLVGLGALLLLPHVGIKAIPPGLNKVAWTASIGALAVGILAHMANPHGRAFAAGEHGGGHGGGGPHGGAGHFEGGHVGGHEGGHEGHEGFRGWGGHGGRWEGGRWIGGYGYPYYGYPGYPYPGYDPYPPVPAYPYYGYPGWGGFYGGRYGWGGRGFGREGHFGGHEGHEGGHEGHEGGGHEGGHAGGGGGHSHAHNARSFFAPAIFPGRSYFNHKSSFKHHEEGVKDQQMLNPSDVLLPREIDTSHYILGSRPAIIDSNMVPSPLISDVY